MRVNPVLRFFVNRFVIATAIFGAMVLFGLFGATRLGVDLLPPFQLPIVAVSTLYPGAGPQEVSDQISKPIEESLNTLSGIDQITSISSEGFSQIVVQFNYGVNPAQASVDVSQKVAAIQSTLPKGAKTPAVQKFDPGAFPILYVALQAPGQNLTQVTDYATQTIKPRLQRVPGVSDVQIQGGASKEVQLLVNPALLAQFRLSPQQVVGALGNSVLSLPAGTLSTQGKRQSYSLRTTPNNASQVAQFLVNPTTGLQAGDLGAVREASARPTSYTRLNGQPVVLLAVRKTPGSNAVNVSHGVHQALGRMGFPKGYQAHITGDTTGFIKATVHDTLSEALITALVVSFVILIFLGKLNSVFSVVLAIPISLSGALVLFALLGFTFNIISLLSLIVAVGIVVDDSIVVAENIDRYHSEGRSLKDAVLMGSSEVISAVSASSLSLLAVFLPISFLPGVIGQFFREFGLGLAAAVFTSWAEALFFLTVRLAYFPDPLPPSWGEARARLLNFAASLRFGLRRFYRPLGLVGLVGFGYLLYRTWGTAGLVGLVLYPLLLGVLHYVLTLIYVLLGAVARTLFGWTEHGFEKLQVWYAAALAKLLRYNGWVLFVAILSFLSIFAILTRIPFNFTPQSDTGVMTADLTLPPGVDLNTTSKLTQQLTDYLLKQSAVETVLSTVGTSNSALSGSANTNKAGLVITLRPRNERSGIQTLTAAYKTSLMRIVKKAFPSANLRLAAQQGGPTGVGGLELTLSALSENSLQRANRRVLAYMKSRGDLLNVRSSLSETFNEQVFVPDPAKLTGTGLTASDIAQALRIYNNGVTAAQIRQQGQEYDIVVRAAPQYVGSQGALLSLPIYAPALGTSLPLGSLGHFKLEQAPSTINRTNQAYSADIKAELAPDSPGALQVQQQIIQTLTGRGVLNQRVTLTTIGASSFLGDLATMAPIAFGLALLLNFLVIASQFNSFRYPLYILLPVPLALVGAFWLIYITGVGLDIISVLGVVMLIGLVTKNAILLLDFAVERAKTMRLDHALVEAARLRLRPILMTTLTVLIISLPLIFGGGEGAEFRRGLGIIILGGLLSSTLLTLFVVPSVFMRFEGPRYDKAARSHSATD